MFDKRIAKPFIYLLFYFFAINLFSVPCECIIYKNVKNLFNERTFVFKLSSQYWCVATLANRNETFHYFLSIFNLIFMIVRCFCIDSCEIVIRLLLLVLYPLLWHIRKNKTNKKKKNQLNDSLFFISEVYVQKKCQLHFCCFFINLKR